MSIILFLHLGLYLLFCTAQTQHLHTLPALQALEENLLTISKAYCVAKPVRTLSAASAASLRIADIRIMIDDEPSPRASSDTRQALTVALVKPGRGACWNHTRNSSSAMLYTRFVIGEETLSRTSAFSFSHPAIFPLQLNRS
jgi:hypothetical protein